MEVIRLESSTLRFASRIRCTTIGIATIAIIIDDDPRNPALSPMMSIVAIQMQWSNRGAPSWRPATQARTWASMIVPSTTSTPVACILALRRLRQRWSST